MIVGIYFHGDSTRIGLIQHGCYGEALHIIVNFASAKHRHAERVVDVRTELSDLRDELISFDRRTLQWLHDRMAAAFRMEYCLNADLFTHATKNPHTPSEVTNLWLDFLRKELARVFEQYLQFPRLILTAVLYPNSDQKGKDAENKIYELTQFLYPDLEMNHTEHEENIVDPYQNRSVDFNRPESNLKLVNAQLDQDLLLAGFTIAGTYFENGVRDFGDYAAAMIDELGADIMPYLLVFWQSLRYFPDFDTHGMTSVKDSKKLHEELLLEQRRRNDNSVTEKGLSLQIVGNIKKERKTYEDEDVTHNREMHHQTPVFSTSPE